MGMTWDKKRQALEKAGMDAAAVRLDSAACVREAVRFADEVSKAGADWMPIRAKGLGFSASNLYYMALLLRTAPFEAPPVMRMAKQMLASAAEMGHGPATVTMANLALRDVVRRHKEPGLPQRSDAPEFWRIMDRFDKHFTQQAAKQDPDVLTLAGVLAFAQGDKAKAMKYLTAAEPAAERRAALALAGQESPPAAPEASRTTSPADRRRRPRWDLESQALLTLGMLYQSKGLTDAAKDIFLTAARQLEVPEACLRLGLLLSPENPAEAPLKESFLCKAAMSGMEGALAPLAELHRGKALAAEAAGSLEVAAHHKLMAKQWEALAAAEE